MLNPKVSVIIPVYNVEKYLRECLESVVKQTLEDIEIICVNDGSTDHSPEILDEYAEQDKRIRVVHKNNAGYGHTMNVGLDHAQGEYIGIVESDDYASLDMFEQLYFAAKNNDAEIVRSNYITFTSEAENDPAICSVFDDIPYGKIINPKDYFDLFKVRPCIWTGIYKRSFLLENKIRFHETPGASFQDLSFSLCTYAMAERVYIIEDAFLHYRVDNANSSVKSKAKIFCVCEEYEFLDVFLESKPTLQKKLEYLIPALKSENYRWNYERLAPQYQYEFLMRWYEELREQKKIALLQSKHFKPHLWNIINKILIDPESFLLETTSAKKDTEGWFLMPPKNTVDNIEISVIVPAYNVEDYVEKCLESICSEKKRSLEIICVDDGSTDGTLKKIYDYAKTDQRISVFVQKNQGLSVARNRGLEHARGEYIYFIDSDDYLESDSLDILYQTIMSKDLDILYFDAESFFETTDLEKKFSGQEYYYRKQEYSEIYTGQNLFQLMQQNNEYRVSACLQIIKLSFLHEMNIKFFEGIIYEDNLFTMLTLIQAKRVGHINRPFYKRRRHENSITGKAITFKNVYGYFSVYIQILNLFIARTDLELETQKWILRELKWILQCVKSYYQNLTAVEKNEVTKLSIREQYLFELLVSDVPKNILYETNTKVSLTKKSRMLRKIKNGFRCYREHGLRYTLSKIYHQFKK